jgi:protein archease
VKKEAATPNEFVEIVEHTADWSLHVTGADLRQLFLHAAEGLARIIVEDPSLVSCDTRRDIVLEAYDAETLLVDWLSELAFWAESEQAVLCSAEIRQISGTRLTAEVLTGRAPALDKHVKAVTFHDLAIEKAPEGLEVTVVFDV